MMPEMWIKKIIRGNVVTEKRQAGKLGNEKMRELENGVKANNARNTDN